MEIVYRQMFMESLHKICKAFNCDVGDICEMKG